MPLNVLVWRQAGDCHRAYHVLMSTKKQAKTWSHANNPPSGVSELGDCGCVGNSDSGVTGEADLTSTNTSDESLHSA
jgi:hypothetical protein